VSKESKRRDIARQGTAAAHDRDPRWCVSCGYYPVVNNGEHRGDCIRTPHSAAVALCKKLLGGVVIGVEILPEGPQR
jgi:hypothetical protein